MIWNSGAAPQQREEKPEPTLEQHIAEARRRLAEAEAIYRKAERAYTRAVEDGGLDEAESANRVRQAAADRLHEARVSAACVLRATEGRLGSYVPR